MARVFKLPDGFTIALVSHPAPSAGQELLGSKSTWVVTGSAYMCATCGTTHSIPEIPTTLVCQTCENRALRESAASTNDSGNGGGGNGGIIKLISSDQIRVIRHPIGSFGTPQKPLRYGPIDRDVEMKFVSGPVTVTDNGGVATIDATVDGLDRHTCWVKWDENRRALEGGRGYVIHLLTDAQIVAAKLYQRGLWTIAREMNGPPRPSKPKLTILVDQDIED